MFRLASARLLSSPSRPEIHLLSQLGPEVRHQQPTSLPDLLKVLQQGTPFKIFGLSPSRYPLDQPHLKQVYQSVMKVCHPDAYTSAPETQTLMSEISTIVSKSYKALIKGTSRAELILEALGVPLDEDSRVDQETLIELMEIREGWEEGDTLQVKASLQDELGRCEAQFAQHIENGEYEAGRTGYIRWKMLEKVWEDFETDSN